MKALTEKKVTPIEISKKTGIALSHVSNTLAELLENDLAVCLTPKLKKGRLYDLTSQGKKIVESL